MVTPRDGTGDLHHLLPFLISGVAQRRSRIGATAKENRSKCCETFERAVSARNMNKQKASSNDGGFDCDERSESRR
jgi:hypothetical protein